MKKISDKSIPVGEAREFAIEKIRKEVLEIIKKSDLGFEFVRTGYFNRKTNRFEVERYKDLEDLFVVITETNIKEGRFSKLLRQEEKKVICSMDLGGHGEGLVIGWEDTSRISLTVNLYGAEPNQKLTELFQKFKEAGIEVKTELDATFKPLLRRIIEI